MKLRFTKMHGAGNDFIVLDATRAPLRLGRAQLRALADRHFGIGADQILVIEPPRTPGIDFAYRIFNSSGEEVEHCGNGARCFVRYVRDKGLSPLDAIRVETVNNVLELRLQPDGRVTVDMNRPVFDLDRVPFDAQGLTPALVNGFALWPLDLAAPDGALTVPVAVLSMGNPHAVQRVPEVERAPVATLGPLVESHRRFPQRVNAGFMEVVSRRHIRLRVYERGAGETLACGTGACAAVVAGIRLGWLDATVDVDTRGGRLTVSWGGPADSPGAALEGHAPHVLMTGPAQTVFEGEVEVPEGAPAFALHQ